MTLTRHEPVHTTFGHTTLHYRSSQDGVAAARLFRLLGFSIREEIALPDGGVFYHFLVDPSASNNGDGIIYLVPQRRAVNWLYDGIHEALGIGTDHEHPAVAKVRQFEEDDPEAGFHVGFLKTSLEDLETTVLKIQAAAAREEGLKDRIQIILNRAKPGTADVDARMDVSPIYGNVTRYTYGRNGVQAFFRTDLLCAGPLGENVVIELDYVFPGYSENMLTKTEM